MGEQSSVMDSRFRGNDNGFIQISKKQGNRFRTPLRKRLPR